MEPITGIGKGLLLVLVLVLVLVLTSCSTSFMAFLAFLPSELHRWRAQRAAGVSVTIGGPVVDWRPRIDARPSMADGWPRIDARPSITDGWRSRAMLSCGRASCRGASVGRSRRTRRRRCGSRVTTCRSAVKSTWRPPPMSHSACATARATS